ncbi:hypothetical protein [Shumkonia mesophila]|uniref:hypothetical protein n=1 Tax=Shumkonia mesophila TaxID=2838854 RepID=UPI002934D0A9|nr:hypothetical protein [Shumkonia mesophila]
MEEPYFSVEIAGITVELVDVSDDRSRDEHLFMMRGAPERWKLGPPVRNYDTRQAAQEDADRVIVRILSLCHATERDRFTWSPAGAEWRYRIAHQGHSSASASTPIRSS